MALATNDIHTRHLFAWVESGKRASHVHRHSEANRRCSAGAFGRTARTACPAVETRMVLWRLCRCRLHPRFQQSVEPLVPKPWYYLPRQRSGPEHGRALPEETGFPNLTLGNGADAS